MGGVTSQMSIRSRLSTALLAIIVLFGVMIVVFYWGQGKQTTAVNHLREAVEKQLDVVTLASRIRNQNRRSVLLRTLMSSGGANAVQPEELASIEKNVNALNADMVWLTARSDDTDNDYMQTAQLAFATLVERWQAFFDALGEGKGKTAARRLDWGEDFQRVMGAFNDLQEAQKLAVERAGSTIEDSKRVVERITYLIFGLSTLIALVFGYTLVHALSKGVETLRDGARQIAQGNIRFDIELDSRDELAELAETLNHMSEQLANAIEDADEARHNADLANHAKSQFLANMSHELRTPLNAIIGYSEMLQEEAGEMTPDEVVADLDKILSAGRHLLSLINHVLDLSKIEAGKMQLYVETFEVTPVLQDLENTIGPLVSKNGNRLRLEVDEALKTLSTDQTKLRQSLLNLLSNACKFTHDGEISLTARRVREGDREWAEFVVADTGIGMSGEELSRIFDAFSQAELATTKQYGGTGLGLAISKKFCLMMGGDITVASTPGEGSAFTVRLPLADLSATTSSAPAQLQIAGEGKVILVIDDDTAVLELAQRQLVKQGFSVVTARSGPEGIGLAKEVRPAVITLDILMPGMDGWQVLSALKADPDTMEIPVILMSMIEDKELGFALGAADYLPKPVDRDHLSRLLKCLISEHQNGDILIADSDWENGMSLERTLHQHGYQVRRVENGNDALAAMEAAVPDVIFLDLTLPEVDGLEFLERLAARPDWKDVPVLVVTDKELSPADRDRLSGSVQRVLTKSGNTPEHLLTQICEIVAKDDARPRSPS